MLEFVLQRLPSTDELPCSDDTPVDNEDQKLNSNAQIWSENAQKLNDSKRKPNAKNGSSEIYF
jgi:hypothetical protein